MCQWTLPSGDTCAHPSQQVSRYGLSLCTRHVGKLVLYFMDELRYHAFDDGGDHLGPRVLSELNHYAEKNLDCPVWEWVAIMEMRRQVRERRLSQGGQFVYFAERDGFVKIGTTGNIRERIKALEGGGQMLAGMTAGPIRLLHTVRGGYPEERAFHEQFSHLRVDPRREWFLLDGTLKDFLEEAGPCLP